MTRRAALLALAERKREWHLAVLTSHLLWPGTGIVDGAFWVLDQVRALAAQEDGK